MTLKFYLCLQGCHHKNRESLFKMLKKQNVSFLECSDFSNLDETFDVLISTATFFEPESIPKRCKVIFGPHFFVFPEDENHPIRKCKTYDPTRFFYNTLSDWVHTLYLEFWKEPTLQLISCPFGIDTDSIVPIERKKKDKVMIYFKHRSRIELEYILFLLHSMNEEFYLITYGNYNDSDFKRKLQEVKFVIWIGCHESQGFAFQECMAMDVPILCWDVSSMYQEMDYDRPIYEHYRPKGYQFKATTANVWNEDCGIKVYTQFELPNALFDMNEKYETFHPRKAIEESVSLDKAYHNMIKLIGL